MSLQERNPPPGEGGPSVAKPPPPPAPPEPWPFVSAIRATRVASIGAHIAMPPEWSPQAHYTIEFRHEESGKLYRAVGVAFEVVEQPEVSVEPE